MNILVVSENFSRGGLETNINTLHNELKKHNKLVYAFGKYEKTSYLNDAKMYSDFHFNYDVTIADFCSDVDRLVKIIEAEKIDVVQVHPFYSVYQAFFATQLTGTKLVYTCHGYGSLTFTPNLFDEILLEYIFEKGVSLNIGVSEKLDGLELFDPGRMADRILGMGDVVSLVEKASEVIDEKEAEKALKKMQKGKYDLEDFLSQMKQIRKLGPLENLIKLIPGAKKMGLTDVQIDPKQIAHIEAIIQSMTMEERQNPYIIKATRKQRIAKGSGRNVQEVNRLLDQFEKYKQMMKGISNGNFKMPF